MKRYDIQKVANEMSLFSGGKLSSIAEVLVMLCNALKRRGVRWAGAMSLVLFLKGAHDVVHDCDILIHPDDIEIFEEVFESLGGKINRNTEQKPAFTSPYYQEAELKGVHFDLIANITIEVMGTVYRYSLEDVEVVTLNKDINVPIVPMEAQYIMYYLMIAWDNRRMFKANICEEYLRQEGVKHPEVFRRALRGCELYSEKYGRKSNWQLPEELKLTIAEMLTLTEKNF